MIEIGEQLIFRQFFSEFVNSVLKREMTTHFENFTSITMVHTKDEKVEIILIFAVQNECARATARIFNEQHENRNLTHKYILDLVAKFWETGAFANKKRNRMHPITNEINQVEVLGQVAVNPTMSTRQLINRHNCRYWSQNNLHLLREEHTQWPQKLNVWAGILGNTIIGPIFIQGDLNGMANLDMLQNLIEPLIMDAVNTDFDDDGNPNLLAENIFSQQDDAPPHYILQVREWQSQNFPDK
ncbi:unnamed protein product [Phaedon cochleariae]|uniref:Uncharacterized protein n=1 Tax=Phaedon cochleariae TaxID=80249 RepID=A0A9N9SBK1_PHACE|nr:unnamed protein product [Phaedon cochleariae]